MYIHLLALLSFKIEYDKSVMFKMNLNNFSLLYFTCIT